MNHHEGHGELPRLTDEVVRLLYRICEDATKSDRPPLNALFAAYDQLLADQDVSAEDDDAIYNSIMHLGKGTGASEQPRENIDLIKRLKDGLQGQGIELQDFDVQHDGQAGNAIEPTTPSTVRVSKRTNRRVSFDEARFEERWLSEHSESINVPADGVDSRLLAQPPRKRSHLRSQRRARSSSSERIRPLESAEVEADEPRDVSSRDDHTMERESHNYLHPTLLFEPSYTQLELNAEAFLTTSDVRLLRRAIYYWHDATIQFQESRKQTLSQATAHDRRKLLKEAISRWSVRLDQRHDEKRREKLFKYQEQKASRERNGMVMRKALTHWSTVSQDELRRTQSRQHWILMVRYFRRWKDLAIENHAKAKSIICGKYLGIWRRQLAKRSMNDRAAQLHYDERLVRSFRFEWGWQAVERRAPKRHEFCIVKRAFNHLKTVFQARRNVWNEVEYRFGAHTASFCLSALHKASRQQQELSISAQRQHDRIRLETHFHLLNAAVKLAPLAVEFSMKVELNLERKAFRLWHLRTLQSQQAKEKHQQHVLRAVLTRMRHELRLNWLSRNYNDRIVQENLLKWVLAKLLREKRHADDQQSLKRGLLYWRDRVRDFTACVQSAELVFFERQHRRQMAFGMTSLYIAMRRHEDATRAAIEFRNSHVVPKTMDIWKGKTDHARQLAKWAADARYFFLCRSALTTWSQRADDHRQQRRRDAYTQIRAMVKIRMARQCLTQWRSKTTERISMEDEAGRRAEAQAKNHAAQVFRTWKTKRAMIAALNDQAHAIDSDKLTSSALFALAVRQAVVAGMQERSLELRYETHLAVMASGLKRIQWARFTAALRVESAEALWARNRDQHVRTMLRHWTLQATSRRNARRSQVPASQAFYGDDEPPDSPSDRPANKISARSAERMQILQSSPPTGEMPDNTTPAYLRTPSRSHRRTNRFRPLPTPAPFTPMAFDRGYLATTPAPLGAAAVDAVARSIPPASEHAQVDIENEAFLQLPRLSETEGLTAQVTPFARKLRAGGFTPATARRSAMPPSALKRSSVFARSHQERGTAISGLNKSVRFGSSSRFSTTNPLHGSDGIERARPMSENDNEIQDNLKEV